MSNPQSTQGWPPDVSARIAKHIAQTRFEDIPENVLELAKLAILDTFSSAVAGSISPVAHEVSDQITEWGGREESTQWVFGGRLPAPQAALVNGMLVHTLDMDAVHDDAIVHAYTCVIPAAVAAGEQVGASGRDLLAAVALGTDFALRLGLACGFYRGFILTATLGGFGAAASASRVLRLDSEKTLNALGIYYSQAAGNRQAFAEAASTTRYQPGFSARNGVLSAVFARRGLSGAHQPLEGRFGYFNVYFEGDQPNLAALTTELGRRYENVGMSFKPYPSCRGAHAPVDAALSLRQSHHLKAADVKEIVIRTPTSSLFTLIGRPFEVKSVPHIDAQYSIPYAVANAVVRGRFFVQDLREEAIRDPEVLEMANRVRVLPVYDVPNKNALTPIELEMHLVDGTVLSQRVEFSKGHPLNPMTREELTDKFRQTVQENGATRIQPNVNRIIDLVEHLEDLADVRELGRLYG